MDGEVDEVLLRDELPAPSGRGWPSCRPSVAELLELLAGRPTRAYEEISRLLGIPVGSIGPTRARALPSYATPGRCVPAQARGRGRGRRGWSPCPSFSDATSTGSSGRRRPDRDVPAEWRDAARAAYSWRTSTRSCWR